MFRLSQPSFIFNHNKKAGTGFTVPADIKKYIYKRRKNLKATLRCNNYLFTLAPPPFMMDSTSSLLAIEVSPGVVIARAP